MNGSVHATPNFEPNQIEVSSGFAQLKDDTTYPKARLPSPILNGILDRCQVR